MFDMIALIYGRPQITIDYKKDYISHIHTRPQLPYHLLKCLKITGPGPWSEKLQVLQISRFLQVSELWVWTIVPFSLLIEEV